MSRVINAKYGAIAESVRDWKRDKRPAEAVRLCPSVGGGWFVEMKVVKEWGPTSTRSRKWRTAFSRRLVLFFNR
jgi:hypothetical protein